ncbi:MAG: helical backbone metal receptor [Phycisphaerae bacterium]|jgi:iron complex transport system substrate-binding protein
MKQNTKSLILLPALAIAIILLVISIRQNILTPAVKISPSQSCARIISLAPNVTEILFSLGLGEHVIGVSEFCNYPAEAKDRPRFGALMNPNYEAILAARPDLVIVLDEMVRGENKFAAMGINILAVKHDSINDILDSILAIGRVCDANEQAMKLVNELENKMSAIKTQSDARRKPKVLISVGHDISQDPDKSPENVYIAGRDGFYSDMIEKAGGQNAYAGSIQFPAVSYESIVSMNPEVIIDVMTASPEKNIFDPEIIKKQWKKIGMIDAVKNDKIYVLTEDFVAIPGPRFILTLEKIASAINPELKLKINEPNSN